MFNIRNFPSLLVLFFILFALGCSTSDKSTTQQSSTEINKLILISFDGFRHDYFSKTETPNFDSFIKSGVKSEALIPIFPTKTFPNHYSIATGLYPENSGFIGNNMFDPETGEYFTMSDRDAVENPDWYGGEPIWNTAEKQGVKAGTMFWVGSEAPVQNLRPTHWMKYDGSISDSSRIDSVLTWMTSGDENEIDLATLYFSFVDSQGHRHGPDSREVDEAIQRADDLLGYLMNQLQQKELVDNTNIIIVSDHGMAEVSRDKIVVLDEKINPSDVKIIEGTPSMMLNVKEGKLEEVYESLKEQEEHFKVFKKQDIPERFHLKSHRRVPDLLLGADLGYTINTQKYFDDHPQYPSGGTHGFDNQEVEMHGIFIAAGPGFKDGYTTNAFEAIHIYNLMAHLLNIKPATNDGSFEEISEVLE